jgi:hypothetical protein
MMMINLFSRRNPSQTEEEAPLPKHRSTRKQLTAKETTDDDASSKKCWWKDGMCKKKKKKKKKRNSGLKTEQTR